MCIRWRYTQLGAIGFVALTYGFLTWQETVEMRIFMQDDGRHWGALWWFFKAYCSAVSTVLFMPVRFL